MIIDSIKEKLNNISVESVAKLALDNMSLRTKVIAGTAIASALGPVGIVVGGAAAAAIYFNSKSNKTDIHQDIDTLAAKAKNAYVNPSRIEVNVMDAKADPMLTTMAKMNLSALISMKKENSKLLAGLTIMPEDMDKVNQFIDTESNNPSDQKVSKSSVSAEDINKWRSSKVDKKQNKAFSL